MLTITLPQRLNSGTVSSYYQRVLNGVKEQEAKEVIFDFNRLKFIDPAGVVTMWNIVNLLEKEYACTISYNTPSDYIDHPRDYPTVDYLDDSLFFEKVKGTKLHPGSHERSTTNGLEQLQTGQFNQMYIDKTIAWLKHNVSLRSKSFAFLSTVFGELFNNLNDHSLSPVGGCVFAQHYPANREITLCISDFGRGIANSMRQKFSHDDKGRPLVHDHQLIDYATGHKVSTKSKPGNRGLGLENLLAIMKSNKGSINILSNEGALEYNYNNDTERKRMYQTSGYYQGTLVLLIFRTDTLEVDEEEDLSWY